MTAPDPLATIRANSKRIWDEATEANANGTVRWDSGDDVPDVDDDHGWTSSDYDRAADNAAGYNYPNG